MADRSVSARWRALSLILIGLVAGTLLLTPAGAHVTTPGHLWKKHIRPQADNRYARAPMWAHIKGVGTIVAQSGGISVFRGGAGSYFVTFPRSVWNKSVAGSLSRLSGGVTGEIVTTPCGEEPQGAACVSSNNKRTVLVNIRNSAGTTGIDRAFYVTVMR